MANSHSLDLESTSSQYASISDGSQTGLDLSGDFTIMAWVNMESLPASGNHMGIVAKIGGAGQFGYFFSVYNNAGTMSVSGGVSSNGNDFDYHTIATSTFNTGTWYHLAYVFTAASHKMELYKNGVSAGTDTSGSITSIYNNTQPVYVGAINQGTPGSFFDGLIDEIKIYNDVRTTSEILNDMYTSPPTGNNLQAYWALNNAYTDASGNSNTLTATGSPVFSTTVPFENYMGGGGFFAII